MSEYLAFNPDIDSEPNRNESEFDITGGVFREPDPERIADINQSSEIRAKIPTTVMYVLELGGHVPTPEELSKPLEFLNPDMDDLERERAVDEFMRLTEKVDKVQKKVGAAVDRGFTFGSKQLDELRSLTKHHQGTKKYGTPVLRILKHMSTPQGEHFEPMIGLRVARYSETALRLLIADQEGQDIPNRLAIVE